MNLGDYLKMHKIVGIEGVDTRALTLMLRKSGTMRGVITTDLTLSGQALKDKLASLDNSKVISDCTTDNKYVLEGTGKKVAFLDLGAKQGILRELHKRHCHITVYPAYTTAEEMLADDPDCIFLSNGPGDPKDVPQIIETVKNLVGKKPILGVCMGNQLICLALGGNTKKMVFGHHGGNHPVRDVRSGKVYITSQNHEYVLDELPDCLEATFVNVNDGTIEGVAHKTLPIYSVQFHPEASPGPLDTNVLFDRLLQIVERGDANA